ncbi:hypothetical protein, partial [Streptomyces roseofulvus]
MSGLERIREEEFSAYLDGELPAARAALVARAVEDDAALAARLAAFVEDRDRLIRLTAPLASRKLPAAWLDRIAAETGAPVAATPAAETVAPPTAPKAA